jgi:alanyl-tRNA synthetase
MQSELQRLLQLDFFEKEEFKRKQCLSCGAHYWTADPDQKFCGDAPCVPYTFIENPLGTKRHSLSSMREAFLSFFEKRGHTRLARYPVVARWRSDVFLTIASIADFQPHVTSGEVPPPANPLVISQPSIRLNDLEAVGQSGRHLTMFEMMGHHAFNNHEEVYWSEETTQYCHDVLTELGVRKEQTIYKEGEWFGGGNAGACLEVLTAGMEIATLVFMSLERSAEGPFVVNNEHYKKMPLRVVDTGYGLERLVWLTQGSPTVYDAIFPSVILAIKEATDNSDKALRDVYALSDHTRCLAFMLSDGIVPSNTEEGYLARLLIRRALRFMSRLNLRMSLFDVMEMHLQILVKDFPDLSNNKDTMHAMLEKETGKYFETLRKGRRLIARHIKDHGTISTEKLIQFYDTHGIPPEVVKEVAGNAVRIPDNFDSMVAESHSRLLQKQEDEEASKFSTKQLYYEQPYQKEFSAQVLWSGTTDGHSAVILDQTLFYPMGGGQTSDTGVLIQNKTERKVLRAQKKGAAIVHILDGPLENGPVSGSIEWDRRYAIMRHHTATHIVNAAARKILGKHIWQKGSQLDEQEGRLDVSHYQRISSVELRNIELEAYRVVMAAKPVIKTLSPRNEAEKKYGMALYQGGAPKGNQLRVVSIPDEEVEACGGIHVDNTSEIGLIKIVGTERIQDGVERLRFKAGYAALEYVQFEEGLLKNAAEILNVAPELLPQSVGRFFNEWKQLRKEVEDLQKQLANKRSIAELYHGIEIVTQDNLTQAAIKDITYKDKAIVISGNVKDDKAMLYIASSPKIDIDCSIIAIPSGKILGGGSGGKKDMAQAGGPDFDKLPDAKNQAIIMIKKQIDEKNL